MECYRYPYGNGWVVLTILHFDDGPESLLRPMEPGDEDIEEISEVEAWRLERETLMRRLT